MRRSFVPFLALLAWGCADKTAILVEVTSDDLSIPADIDALHFEATSETGRRVDETYTVQSTWPHSLSILPADRDSSSIIVITVTGLRSGVPRVRRVVQTAFDPGATRRVVVALTRDCVGVTCAEGVDCVSGMCVGTPPIDGGVDAGRDGGRDAGPGDAGSDDAGRDGGMDAGEDAGTPPSDAGAPDAGPDAGPPGPLAMMFSEYVEGASNNKALEIVNLGASTVSLSRCSIRRFANGTTTPTPVTLTGSLAPGGVFVLCNGGLEGAATLCNQTTATISHNGDDAYDLFCDGAVLDTFGRIGEDPGTEWAGGGLSTVDYVLRRACSVATGDTDGSDPFDPSVEWTGSAWVDATTSLTGLGNRAECP